MVTTTPNPTSKIALLGTANCARLTDGANHVVGKSAHVFSSDAFRAAARLTLDDMEGGLGGSLNVSMPSCEPVGGGAAQTLRNGARGNAVTRLQQLLQAQGYNVGTIDGAFGPTTEAAVRAFQQRSGLQVDGAVGPQTWRALNGDRPAAPAAPAPSRPATPERPANTDPSGTHNRLWAGLRNRWKGSRHNCFRYAWSTISHAGGRGIGAAQQSRTGRGNDTSHLSALAANGHIKPGDVIYVNRRPGADPSSTNLRYGPHWFVYMGNNQYADQYGVRSANAMADFVPGRKIDTIYHTMA